MGLFHKKWRIATISGFPIEVNLTFLILLGLVVLTGNILSGLWLATAVAASVIVHELGHALVARRLGVRIAGIEMQFFGGVAKMVTPPRSARDEILIALAGPAVSLGIALVVIFLAVTVRSRLLMQLGITNLILGVFNLLPALPLDGGRVYRAFRARRLGVMAATQKAVTLSKYIAIGLGVLGLVGIPGILAPSFFLAILALMIYLMSRAELAAAWTLHYHDTPTERIDYDILDPAGRVIYDPRGNEGAAPDEERFNRVHRVTFRQRRW
ncbi:MAG: M50 family metallopeptidase [Deltaproteobacteria bacterium]|nr:M50 family metallopeptidase [Deltaproteobacteria bacterium]